MKLITLFILGTLALSGFSQAPPFLVDTSSNIDTREVKFKKEEMPVFIELQSCKCIEGYYIYQRKTECKRLFSQYQAELREKLKTTQYSSVSKYAVYLELFRLSMYFRNPDIHLLDSSFTFLYQYIGEQEEITPRDRFKTDQTFLFDSVNAMLGFMVKNHRWRFNLLRRNYENSLESGTCGQVNMGKMERYQIDVGKLMYEKKYYRFAYEYFYSLGLTLNNSENRGIYNWIEREKMSCYIETMVELFEPETIEKMKLEALNNIKIDSSQWKECGYTYLGNHLIKVPIDFDKHRDSLTSEELIELAKEKLLKSVIFENNE